MEKTATLNLRVNPVLKQNAEKVLERLGIPMSTAIDIYLNQIVMAKGIPFDVSLPDKSNKKDDNLIVKSGTEHKKLKNKKGNKNIDLIEVEQAFKDFFKKHPE